jgi:hypothetical protein
MRPSRITKNSFYLNFEGRLLDLFFFHSSAIVMRLGRNNLIAEK